MADTTEKLVVLVANILQVLHRRDPTIVQELKDIFDREVEMNPGNEAAFELRNQVQVWMEKLNN